MKKTIAVLLVLLLGMTALLAGCGSGGGSQEESDPSVLKVGYIFPGSIIDGEGSASQGQDLVFYVRSPVKLYHMARIYDEYDGGMKD